MKPLDKLRWLVVYSVKVIYGLCTHTTSQIPCLHVGALVDYLNRQAQTYDIVSEVYSEVSMIEIDR